MHQRTEFEKDMRRTPTSPSPRFSRTFDMLLSRFPEATQISTPPSNMTSNKTGYLSSTWDEQSPYKPTQWRSTVSAPLCAFCNKAVFPAEEVIGAGQKYHKLCLKCISCNNLLNSGNVNEHEKKIYCIGCYRRQFGPHGVGRGLGTTTSPSLDTPPSSPSFHQTEPKSNSQLTNSENDEFQRDTSLNSTRSRTFSDDDSRYNNPQMNSVTFIGGVTTRQTVSPLQRPPSNSLTNGTAFKMMSLSGNICPRCSKPVYSAEEVKAAGKSFHKRCYTCAHCKKSINAARYSEHEGELYDNNCYQRLFGPKGVGFGIGSGTLSTGN
jgi:cysteine/glycine-rich protein